MRKLPTYPILLAVMLVCIAAKVGYASAYYYDYRGRTVQSVEANRLGGYDRTTTGYDYVGNPIFTELTHSTAADPTGIRQQWEREYDRQGRELTVRHRLGGGQWTTLSAKEYDPLGRLQSETAGITSTYAYDIRSRQTSITSDRYNQWLDFTPGGNVSRMKWRTKWLGEYDRTYDFDYDGLSRLTAATYNDSGGNAGHYNTSYSYDLNGNVTSLDRRGIVDPDADRKDGFIDRLTYEYRGNKVTRIIDDAPALTYQGACDFVDVADEDVEYTYDASGNTVSDLNRGIVRITYDVNHRPRTISFSNGAQTRYIYDAQGRKLRTEHSVPSLQPTLPGEIDADQPLETTVTDYCGQFIYEDGVLDRINLSGGYLSYHNTSGLRLTTPEYHYYQRDHLDNNRVDIPSSGGVSQVTNYYPFGLPMYAGFGRDRQRWKFGGKEFDRVNGLDLYDFEARAYDPATIRMWRPDDLSEKYYPISPFAYCANNPLILTDPTGQVLETAWDAASLAIGVTSFIDNVRQGNAKAAVVDGIGIAVDALAAAIPMVPGGAGAGIKAYRGGKAAVEAATDATSVAAKGGMKNAGAIAEGRAFEKEFIEQLRASGAEVYTNIRLVPDNGIGNVAGNRTNVDALVKNSDGTYTIYEIKLRESTHLSKGQNAAKSHVENVSGNQSFTVRSTEKNGKQVPSDITIKVTEYKVEPKYGN